MYNLSMLNSYYRDNSANSTIFQLNGFRIRSGKKISHSKYGTGPAFVMTLNAYFKFNKHKRHHQVYKYQTPHSISYQYQ